MVGYINLAIPPGTDVENPIEDTAFMAWIGAKRIDDINGYSADDETKFELTNPETWKRFTFSLCQFFGRTYWTMQRVALTDKCVRSCVNDTRA